MHRHGHVHQVPSKSPAHQLVWPLAGSLRLGFCQRGREIAVNVALPGGYIFFVCE